MAEQDLQFDALSPLLAALCDGTLDGDGFAHLERLLTTDPAARQWYIAYMDLHGELCWDHRRSEGRGERGKGRGLDTSVPSMLPTSDASDSIIPPIIISSLPSPLSSLPCFLGSALFSYLIAAVILSTALAIAWAWKLPNSSHIAVQSVPSPSPLVASPSAGMTFIGRITGMVDCQWSDPHTAVPGPVAVPLGRKYALSSGLMEITYDTGARVILQGPCTYEVESAAGGFLSVGKLTARVEKKATNLPSPSGRGAGGEGGEKNGDHNESRSALTLALPHGERGPGSRSSFLIPHSYFAVRTPTATVTDLGTEFGVEVDDRGQTMSHVYRGSVKLAVAATDGHAETTAQVLHENESASVTKKPDAHGSDTRLTVVRLTTPVVSFVREIPKPQIKRLDLADVVAGGDGFSGQRNRGIDPTNGRVADSMSVEYLLGDGKYHRVQGMPFVDGVFMPYRKTADDSVQLDSAGHAFRDFRAAEDQTIGHVWAGKGEGNCSVVAGVDYSAPGHGMIAMHTNKGITFDLDAVRHANPGCKLLRFRAVAGIAVSPEDNLIANGDFTSGVDGWAGDGLTGRMGADTSSPDGHNLLLKGPYKSHCTAAAVSVEEKQEYKLSFMAANPDATATDSLIVRLSYESENKCTEIGTPFVISADKLNSGWADYTVNWTTVALETANACPRFSFEVVGTSAGEHIAIDNVVFTRVLPPGLADIRVFVDGQVRFQRREVNSENGAMPITVPIKDGDHFLTLTATTIESTHVTSNHVLFGDPRLELLPTATAAVSTR